MSESPSTLTLTVTHRGQAYELHADASATLGELQELIADATSVPVEFQKLLYGKGKKKDGDATTLAASGLRDGARIMLLGSTADEMGSMQAAEREKQRRDAVLAQRARGPPTKLSSRTTMQSDRWRFHRVQPLAHLPDPGAAEALLRRLADDPAVRHVMQLHEFSVGVLTELAPHEHPNLLGLNENAGQAIKLRLRTDRYDGMRLYADVRRVLCHELTHNVWGDHDDNFKKLNSQLNKEVAEFERACAAGTHHLGGGAGEEYYEPGVEADAHSAIMGGSYVLGGTSTPDAGGDSREARRQHMLEAAMRRMREKEEEIEHMCGSESAPRP